MIQELTTALRSAGDDQSVRVVVLAASPPVFSAGHDLRELLAADAKNCSKQIFDACSELMLAIRGLPVPVIASVSGAQHCVSLITRCIHPIIE